MAPKLKKDHAKRDSQASTIVNDLNIDLEAGAGRDHTRDSETTPVNYNTTVLWILTQLLACIFIFLVWAPNPSKGTSIIASGTEFIGAFRKCSGTVCDDWLAGASESTGAAASEVDANPGAGVSKRAGSITDNLDLKGFFATTGTAIVAAFYLSLYTAIFLMVRYRTLRPFTSDIPEIGEGGKAIKTKQKGAKRRGLKIFAYRASRSMGVVNVILLFGILCACGKAVWDVRVKTELKGSDGIGGGLFLIMFALFFSLYSCLRDLASPGGRAYRWVGCWCWCPNKILCVQRKKNPSEGKREPDIEMGSMTPSSKDDRDRKRSEGSQGASSPSSSTRKEKTRGNYV